MEFKFVCEQKIAQETVKEFMRKKIAPVANEITKRDTGYL